MNLDSRQVDSRNIDAPPGDPSHGAPFASWKTASAMAVPGVLGAAALVAIAWVGRSTVIFVPALVAAALVAPLALAAAMFWARRFEARHRAVTDAWRRQAADARRAFEAMAAEASALRVKSDESDATAAQLCEALDAAVESGRAFAEREAAALGRLESAMDGDAVRVWRERAVRSERADFLDALAHELRTPLKAMTEVTELTAKTQKGLNSRGRDNLHRVVRGGHELLRLVDDLAVWIRSTRPSRGIVRETEVFDLPSLVDECVEASRPLLTGKESDFVVRVEDGLKTVRQDREKVRRIVIDLLANAARFTERGDIEVEFLGDEIGRGTSNGASAPSGGLLRIEVRDPGVGFESVDAAFEPFGRIEASTAGRYGSTGLALHLARETARTLGGSVRGRSEPGEGSAFTVELPLLSVTSVAARAARAR